ncbi:Methyltransferase type 12 [Methylophaga frappieri]|uniref:Methyltransferase type 12 n=1 Tax=Methylophaga frappieri (strain ATCC BAA-2434 / DSM 25690 / JAM7) TaxID=754477 RepID=I1YJ41_METFJ|nr:class I SAM-dependent methyltransferase [Methylophaga frappieri]AFJ02934.1 Methyltransferase type 12 [Methylophaga frappieri]
MIDQADKWNRRYRDEADDLKFGAATVLADNLYLLPDRGLALDLACGRGGNAELLARQGLTVDAVDISSVVIQQLQHRAEAAGLPVRAYLAEASTWLKQSVRYDVIVVSHFLQRTLCPVITEALAPGGLLFYQTWCQQRVDEIGPRNPDYLLRENELLRLFQSLRLRYYQELGTLGDTQCGKRNVAMFIGQTRDGNAV